MEYRTSPAEPMGIGKILDQTFSAYFKRFGKFAIFTLLVNGILSIGLFVLEQIFSSYTPFDPAAFENFIENGINNMTDFRTFFSKLQEMVPGGHTPYWIGIISFAASLFVSPIIAGGISCVSTGHYLGESHSAGEWFSIVMSKYKSLFITQICSLLFIIGISIIFTIAFVFLMILLGVITSFIPFLGVLLIIAAVIFIFILVMFMVGSFGMIYPVVIREDTYGFSPAVRAFKLGFMKFWKTVGTVLVTGLIVVIASLIISLILDQIAGIAFPNVFFVSSLIGVIIALFFDPIMPIAINMLYLAIRIQKEGYLSEPAAAEGPAPETRNEAAKENHPELSGMGPESQDDVRQPDVPATPETKDTDSDSDRQDSDKKDGGPQGPELL